MRPLLLLVSAAAVGACGGRQGDRGDVPCTVSVACAGDAVCGPGGACEDLTAPRFATTRRVDVIAWAAAGPARPADGAATGDAMPIGGTGALRAVLAFEEVASGGDAATLVLTPHPDWVGPAAPGTLIVRPARPFRGPELARGEGTPRPLGGVARRRFDAGHRGRYAVTLSPLLEGGGGLPATVEVGLDGGGETAWRFVSPEGLDVSDRPHVALEGLTAAEVRRAREGQW